MPVRYLIKVPVKHLFKMPPLKTVTIERHPASGSLRQSTVMNFSTMHHD